MVVSIIVNGQKVNKDELKDIVINNEVVSGLIRKAAKRQREYTEQKKAKTA